MPKIDLNLIKSVAVDFDGTIIENNFPHGNPMYGMLKPYAREVINALSFRGIQVIIWTCSDENRCEEISRFLWKHRIRHDSIPHTGGKVFADLYIDDRAYGFFGVGVDWKRIAEDMGIQLPARPYMGRGRFKDGNVLFDARRRRLSNLLTGEDMAK